MSAILPPSQRVWWKHPLDRVEGTWVAIALIWCLFMFFMMPWWHVYGKQNLSNEAYKIAPEVFAAKAQEMVDKYTVRTETDRQYLAFADRFEERFIGQSEDESRNIIETLNIAWELLSMLSPDNLTRVSDADIARYHHWEEGDFTPDPDGDAG